MRSRRASGGAQAVGEPHEVEGGGLCLRAFGTRRDPGPQPGRKQPVFDPRRLIGGQEPRLPRRLGGTSLTSEKPRQREPRRIGRRRFFLGDQPLIPGLDFRGRRPGECPGPHGPQRRLVRPGTGSVAELRLRFDPRWKHHAVSLHDHDRVGQRACRLEAAHEQRLHLHGRRGRGSQQVAFEPGELRPHDRRGLLDPVPVLAPPPRPLAADLRADPERREHREHGGRSGDEQVGPAVERPSPACHRGTGAVAMGVVPLTGAAVSTEGDSPFTAASRS